MKITKTQLKQIIKEELEHVLNEVKLDGYDYGFRGDERLEFNNAIRKNPDAARKVARMSVEEVSDWWEEYKKISRGYKAPPGDPGPRGHPYDYPPGEEGRYSYLPIYTAEKYLLKNKIDFLITGSCPRTELAFQKASNKLGIKSLAIADNFLYKELKYICQRDYSNNLSVITRNVANQVKENGFQGKVHVLGNPAFDNLFDERNINEAKKYRQELNLKKGERLIMWAAHPKNAEIYSGRKHVNFNLIINSLTEYCKKNKNTKFLVRQHPNSNLISSNTKFEYGYLCKSEISIETALHATDQLVVESSTVGIQAAIIGKPVITLWHKGYPPYEENGLSKDILDLGELHNALDAKQNPDLSKFSYPLHKNSSELLEDAILQMI